MSKGASVDDTVVGGDGSPGPPPDDEQDSALDCGDESEDDGQDRRSVVNLLKSNYIHVLLNCILSLSRVSINNCFLL